MTLLAQCNFDSGKKLSSFFFPTAFVSKKIEVLLLGLGFSGQMLKSETEPIFIEKFRFGWHQKLRN